MIEGDGHVRNLGRRSISVDARFHARDSLGAGTVSSTLRLRPPCNGVKTRCVESTAGSDAEHGNNHGVDL